jgi:hypothetical protein
MAEMAVAVKKTAIAASDPVSRLIAAGMAAMRF